MKRRRGYDFGSAADAFDAKNENSCGRFVTRTNEDFLERRDETDGSDDTEEHQSYARTVETN